MNPETEQLVPDHDTPVSEGGRTEVANLNLTHRFCNSFKQNNPSIEVRPYLEFDAFVRDRDSEVYYGDCIEFFEIKPKSVDIKDKGDQVEFHLSSGVQVVPVLREKTLDGKREYRFAFVDLPRDAITHDAECQPRSIKPKQLRLIYADLAKNPLHEQPTVRIVDSGKKKKLLLFDGQHKTLAKWLGKFDSVVTKVYLDIGQEEANYLVGSIQSTVKKLPLTPFELASKMSDEYRERYENYLSSAGDQFSEKSFIDWLLPRERTRGLKELESALITSLRDHSDPELEITKRVNATEFGIKEPAFIRTVLKPLIHFKPLTTEGNAGTTERENERLNIILLLNAFEAICIAPGTESGASEQEKLRTKRMLYQSALAHSMSLLKAVVAHEVKRDESEALLKRKLTKPQLKKVESAVKLLAQHPIWTVDFEKSDKTAAVEEALSKNQGAEDAFKGVGLNLAYLLKVEPLDSDNWYR
jgi:hypothetical protein